MPGLISVFFRVISTAVSIGIMYHYANKHLFGLLRTQMANAQQHIQAIKEYCHGLASEQIVIANNIKKDQQEAAVLEQKLVRWADYYQQQLLEKKMISESFAQERDQAIKLQQQKIMHHQAVGMVIMPSVDQARRMLQERFTSQAAGQQFLRDLAHDLKKGVRR